jgi:hypothetical protein
MEKRGLRSERDEDLGREEGHEGGTVTGGGASSPIRTW